MRKFFGAQMAEEAPPILLNFTRLNLRGEAKVKAGAGSATDLAAPEAEGLQNPGDARKKRNLDPFHAAPGYEFVILSYQTYNLTHLTSVVG